MSDSDEYQALVLDIGSGVTRTGYAGDDAPRNVLPTIVGYQRNNCYRIPGLSYQDDCYVGDAAQAFRGVLSLNHPVDKGVVTDWDDMEKLLHHLFYNQLSGSQEDRSVLISEPPLNPKHNKETMAQVLFEKFQVSNFYSCNQGLLSCYASGRGSALMLDVGETITHVVPVFEGHCLQPAIRRYDFGGKDLTIHLQQSLNKKGHDFVTTADFEIVRKIKESICFVSENYDQEIYRAECTASIDKTYTLPDGNEISLCKERFMCPEQLFLGVPEIGFDGIHNMVFESISSMDMDVRRHYHCNIILSGGTTMLPGFPERLQREFISLVSSPIVKVVSPPERKYMVWIGGSILASLSTFQTWWISRQEYEEYGPDIVNRKCY